jgi:cell division inhibitor SulA
VPPALKLLARFAESDTDEPRTAEVADTVVVSVGLVMLTTTLVLPLLVA